MAKASATLPAEPAVDALVSMANIALKFRGGETTPTIAEISRVVGRCSVVVLKLKDDKDAAENDAILALGHQYGLVKN